MMTPQEVANCTFAKATLGGYNMASVDDFLDKLTEDYSSLYKENAALKAKLKVTVDKLAEYREMEGAMSSTLLTAQKMASAMMTEAEQKRDAMIVEASRTAKERLAALKEEVAAQERHLEEVRAQVNRELEVERGRLAAGQEQLRAFIRDVRAVCNEELAALDLLPELPPEPAAPPPLAVAAMAAMTAAEPAEEPAEEAAPPETEEDEVKRNLQDVLSAIAAEPAAEAGEPVGDPFAEEGTGAGDLEDTRVLNLDDLQFGRNYTKD